MMVLLYFRPLLERVRNRRDLLIERLPCCQDMLTWPARHDVIAEELALALRELDPSFHIHGNRNVMGLVTVLNRSQGADFVLADLTWPDAQDRHAAAFVQVA